MFGWFILTEGVGIPPLSYARAILVLVHLGVEGSLCLLVLGLHSTILVSDNYSSRTHLVLGLLGLGDLLPLKV